MRKVICTECERLIEGDEDPAEFKKCIDCVLRTTPAADMSKIVDHNRRTFESQMPKKTKSHQVKQAFDNFYRPGEKYPTPIALMVITDYEKNHRFDFGLDFDQVEEIYKTMCEMKRQNKKQIDEYHAKLEKDDETGEQPPDNKE